MKSQLKLIQILRGVAETISHLIKSLLFIPSENSKGIIVPIYGLGWTLNYEFYFYLIFAFGLFF